MGAPKSNETRYGNGCNGDGSNFLMIVVNYPDEATNNYKTLTDDYSQIIYTSSSGH